MLIAESEEVLSRAIALLWVARTHSRDLDSGSVGGIREALLEENWSEAVIEWMSAAGEIVDAYPDEEIWTEARLDAERASMEIRMSPIFKSNG